MGMFTPWGAAQQQRQIAPGIVEVSTASHGGIHLNADLNARVHQAWRDAAGWYEEDCEWAIVAVTFPQHFQGQRVEAHGCTVVEYAHDVLRRWFPGQYERVYRVSIGADESHVREEQQVAASVVDKLVSTSAWGHGNDAHGRYLVPPRWVGVSAQVGGRWQPASERSWYLITEDEYATANPYGMLIDPNRHPVWPPLPIEELHRPVTVRPRAMPNLAVRPSPARPGGRHKFMLFGAANPHRGREVGELWRYPAVGDLPERWNAYRNGHGAALGAFDTPDQALEAVGFRLPPMADPAADVDVEAVLAELVAERATIHRERHGQTDVTGERSV